MADRGISPRVSGAVDLGSASKAWRKLYLSDDGLAAMQNDFSSDAAAHNSIFRGKELPYTWAEIQAKVQAGDFSDLYIGDYKEITLTTSETVVMEIAGINCYKNWGGTAIGNHIDFISRDCLATAYQFNTTATNNGDSTHKAPWISSDLTFKLNNPSTGLYATALPSDLQSVIVQKEAYIEQRYSSGGAVSADTGVAWNGTGKLWIPAETEVFDHPTWSEIGYGTAGFVQYPIFRLNPSKIIKGAGNGGASRNWWELSAHRLNASDFCSVNYTGRCGGNSADTNNGVPLCFRIS